MLRFSTELVGLPSESCRWSFEYFKPVAGSAVLNEDATKIISHVRSGDLTAKSLLHLGYEKVPIFSVRRVTCFRKGYKIKMNLIEDEWQFTTSLMLLFTFEEKPKLEIGTGGNKKIQYIKGFESREQHDSTKEFELQSMKHFYSPRLKIQKQHFPTKPCKHVLIPARLVPYLELVNKYGIHIGLQLATEFFREDLSSSSEPKTQQDHNLFKQKVERTFRIIDDALMQFHSYKCNKVPAYGIGAIPRYGQFADQYRHVFNLILNDGDPEIQVRLKSKSSNLTVKSHQWSLHDWYLNTQKMVELSSEAKELSPLLQAARDYCKKQNSNSQRKSPNYYSVLTIVTQGSFADFHSTVQLIQELADSPISIVVISFAEGDDENWKQLDTFKPNTATKGRDNLTYIKYK